MTEETYKREREVEKERFRGRRARCGCEHDSRGTDRQVEREVG